MKLKLALEEKELDVRLRDRLVAEGKLSKGQVETYLAGLPVEAESSFERINHDDNKTTEQ